MDNSRPCLECGKIVSVYARRCKECGARLEPLEQAPDPAKRPSLSAGERLASLVPGEPRPSVQPPGRGLTSTPAAAPLTSSLLPPAFPATDGAAPRMADALDAASVGNLWPAPPRVPSTPAKGLPHSADATQTIELLSETSSPEGTVDYIDVSNTVDADTTMSIDIVDSGAGPDQTMQIQEVRAAAGSSFDQNGALKNVGGEVSPFGTQGILTLPGVEESLQNDLWLVRPILGPLKIWQVGAGVSVLVTGVALLLRLASPQESPPAPLAPPHATAPVPAPTVELDSEQPVPEAENAAPRECRPFSQYPAFPWKKQLAALATLSKDRGLCGAFGASRKAVASALSGLAHGPLTGYDLVPDAMVWELYPDGVIDRRRSRLELLFRNDRLFEVRELLAEGYPSDLGRQTFEPVMGPATRKGLDFRRRFLVRHDDGRVSIELFVDGADSSEDRPARELVFSDLEMRDELGTAQLLRRKTEACIADGIALLEKGKLDEAVREFRKAGKLSPNFGEPFAWEARAQAVRERWAKVEMLLSAIDERSRDGRSMAKAEALRAVRALAAGDPSAAKQAIERAVVLDPADAEIAQCRAGLKNGNYDIEIIARTALRLECLTAHRQDGWTENGVLARGCFAQNEVYKKALKGVSLDDLARGKQRWRSQECR